MGTAPSPLGESYVHPDEARMAAFRRVYDVYRVVEDIYVGLAERFAAAGVTRFAEIGGGRGPISELLAPRGVATCVIDLDEQMLAEAHRPAVRADIQRLPLPDASVDGLAAINCFYFLPDPLVAIREAYRVLRPGGLFVASSPSRFNDPELEGVDPKWATPTTFDSEESTALVAAIFGGVKVEPWRVVGYVLPDTDAIADYLHAFNVERWREKAATLDAPMTITKVGAEVWATR